MSKLKLTQDDFAKLSDAMGRERAVFAQRSASGRLVLFREPAKGFNGKVPTKVFANFTPEETILLGVWLIGMGAETSPETLKKFGLEVAQ